MDFDDNASTVREVGKDDIVNVKAVDYKTIEVRFNEQLEVGSEGEVNTDDTTERFITKAGANSKDTEPMPFSVKESLFSQEEVAEKALVELEKKAVELIITNPLGDDFSALASRTTTSDDKTLYDLAKDEIDEVKSVAKDDLDDRLEQITKIKDAAVKVKALQDAATSTDKLAKLEDTKTLVDGLNKGEIRSKLEEYIVAEEKTISQNKSAEFVTELETTLTLDLSDETNVASYEDALAKAEYYVGLLPEDVNPSTTKKGLEDRITAAETKYGKIKTALTTNKTKIQDAKDAIAELKEAINANLTVAGNITTYSTKLNDAKSAKDLVADPNLKATKEALNGEIEKIETYKTSKVDDAITKVEAYESAAPDAKVATKGTAKTAVEELSKCTIEDVDLTETINALNARLA